MLRCVSKGNSACLLRETEKTLLGIIFTAKQADAIVRQARLVKVEATKRRA